MKYLKLHKYDILAAAILGVFFFLSFLLIRHESVTVDETAHIPAAYSYVMLGDFTLNPEHPPLAKIISGLGFVGSHYTYPTDILHQNNYIGERQWQVGKAFLYHSGNNTDSILMRSRLPLLIAAVLSLFLCYKLFGLVTNKKTAAIALLLLALSPTVIAHGHLVTTDFLVMTTVTIAILCFARYLQKPSLPAGMVAGLALAVAELSKFSAAVLFVLLPLFAGMYFYTQRHKLGIKKTLRVTLKTVWLPLAVTLLVMYAFYAAQIVNQNHTSRDNWINQVVSDNTSILDAGTLIKLNNIPLAGPLVRYIVGFSNALVRVSDGRGTYLLGKRYATGTFIYFPLVSFLKAPTPLLIVCILIAVFIARRIKKFGLKISKVSEAFRSNLQANPGIIFGGIFSVTYFAAACVGTLNIGIRHLLVIFPWVSLFCAIYIVTILDKQTYKKIRVGRMASLIILASYTLTAIFIYPNYLPYTTEIAGGSSNAYRYYNDSNVDWGQSIKYLAEYARQRPDIFPLFVDQSQLEAKKYYICGNSDICSKIIPIDGTQKPPSGSYFAVSETTLTIALSKNQGNLAFLKEKEPIAKISDSIYLFRIED